MIALPGEVKIDAFGEAHRREIERPSSDVDQLDPLEIAGVGRDEAFRAGSARRVIHKLADHEAVEIDADVRLAGGELKWRAPVAPAPGVVLVLDAGAMNGAPAAPPRGGIVIVR